MKDDKLHSLKGYTPKGEYHEFFVEDGDFRLPPATRPGTNFLCVAVAVKKEGVAIRSSCDTEKKTLFFSHEEWAVFLDGIQKGHFQSLGDIDVAIL